MTQETIFTGVPSCRSRPACIKMSVYESKATLRFHLKFDILLHEYQPFECVLQFGNVRCDVTAIWIKIFLPMHFYFKLSHLPAFLESYIWSTSQLNAEQVTIAAGILSELVRDPRNSTTGYADLAERTRKWDRTDINEDLADIILGAASNLIAGVYSLEERYALGELKFDSHTPSRIPQLFGPVVQNPISLIPDSNAPTLLTVTSFTPIVFSSSWAFGEELVLGFLKDAENIIKVSFMKFQRVRIECWRLSTRNYSSHSRYLNIREETGNTKRKEEEENKVKGWE